MYYETRPFGNSKYSIFLTLTNKMPRLSFPHIPESAGSIRFIANKRREYSVTNLTNEDKVTSKPIVEILHLVEINNHVCEPHGSSEVVQYVANTIGQFLEEPQVTLAIAGCHLCCLSRACCAKPTSQ